MLLPMRLIRSPPLRLAVAVMVRAVLKKMVLGAAPQLNVIEPARSRAANRVACVQEAGSPLPTTCTLGAPSRLAGPRASAGRPVAANNRTAAANEATR